MAQVTIVRRDPGISLDEKLAQVKGLHVTYHTPLVPPRSVFVPGEAPTDAEVADAIRKDLATVDEQKPTTLNI
jgi:hypothetical protein